MGIGFPEIIIIVIILLLLFVPSILRKYYPNRLWVGLILCTVLGAIGQMYLPKSIRYVLILGLIFLLARQIGYPYATLFAHLLSVPLIFWRFKKLSPAETDPLAYRHKS